MTLFSVMWMTAAQAGSVQVQMQPMKVFVDGQPVPVDASGTADVRGLVGRHEVEIRTLDGRTIARTSVRLGRRQRLGLQFDGVDLVVSGVGPGQAPGGPPPAQISNAGPTTHTIDEATLSALVGEIKGQSFAEGKLQVLGVGMRDRFLTVEQLGRILGGFSFGSDQVKAVQICRDKVVDPENAFMLAKHFSFDSDAEDALKLFE